MNRLASVAVAFVGALGFAAVGGGTQALVQRLAINRHNGFMQPAED